LHETCENASPTPETDKSPRSILDLDALADAISDRLDLGALESKLDDAIKQALAAIDREPTRTILEVRQPDKPVQVSEGHHYLMARLVKLISAGFHVYMWGPPGSGKTTAAMQAATLLSRESEIDTLDPSTFRSMIQGYRTPTGEEVHTAFTRCWTGGKVYIADETDLAPGHVQTLFNSALANGHAPLAWGQVSKVDGFGFVGTGNTPGRAIEGFSDRKPMSQAFADRLYFLYWPLDAAIECRAAGLEIPAAPSRRETTCSPQDWGMWVRNLRAWAADNAKTLMVTPRATLAGIQALAIGETPAEVADGLVFRGADRDLKAKCLAAVGLPA